jgi:hypothetical protein
VNVKSLLDVGDNEIVVAALCSWSHAGWKLRRSTQQAQHGLDVCLSIRDSDIAPINLLLVSLENNAEGMNIHLPFPVDFKVGGSTCFRLG